MYLCPAIETPLILQVELSKWDAQTPESPAILPPSPTVAIPPLTQTSTPTPGAKTPPLTCCRLPPIPVPFMKERKSLLFMAITIIQPRYNLYSLFLSLFEWNGERIQLLWFADIFNICQWG